MITHFLWKNQLISFVQLLLFIITNSERLKSMMLTHFWAFCHSHLCAFSVSCQYEQRHWVQFPGKLLVIVCYLSNACKVLKLANSSVLARRQNSPARSYSAWCTAWAKSTWIAAFPWWTITESFLANKSLHRKQFIVFLVLNSRIDFLGQECELWG